MTIKFSMVLLTDWCYTLYYKLSQKKEEFIMNPIEFHPFEMQFEVPDSAESIVYTSCLLYTSDAADE